MQEFPQADGASTDSAVPKIRLFATFKLATSNVEVVHGRAGAIDTKVAANFNRFGLVAALPDATSVDRS